MITATTTSPAMATMVNGSSASARLGVARLTTSATSRTAARTRKPGRAVFMAGILAAGSRNPVNSRRPGAPASASAAARGAHRDISQDLAERWVGVGAEGIRQRSADPAPALDRVHDRHVVGIRDALEPMELPDHQVARGNPGARADRLETSVDRAEAL